ncbi:MAG: 16S rRNA (guanine(527)-N(7))-methyltransferase RsmG [Oscillospiraceae bacterium]|nr:16S rRNA (guanine(527)-N(7))-methyltransferase RsmG [Oscillospiraceae bacterium]
MIDRERLTKTAAGYGLDIAHCVDALDRYAEILTEYNQKVNLTAITDPLGIEEKHFLDSLLFAAQPEVTGSLADVGTGAGFPGVVAKLYKPGIKLTLMEPTGKRVDFLRYLCKELGVEAVFVKERAEEAARKQWREAFDVACARGVAALNKLSEYCLPLVKPGGLFIAMKANVEEELAAAQGAFVKLGGEYFETRRQTLPDGSARSLVLVKKISRTSTVYPRNGGKIAKAPLK